MAKTTVSNNYIASNPDYDVRDVTNPTLPGKIQIVTSGFALPDYDTIAVAYISDTKEEYSYLSGGLGGTEVGLIRVTYTDLTKVFLQSVERLS